MISYWLLKTEPQEYSWDDLEEMKAATWDGVRAHAAINNIKKMKPEDLIFIYHTGKTPAIIGIAKVISEPFFNNDTGEWNFNIAAVQKLSKPVTLKQIKESNMFPDWHLVRLPRLSVVPVNVEQWNQVLKWSQ